MGNKFVSDYTNDSRKDYIISGLIQYLDEAKNPVLADMHDQTTVNKLLNTGIESYIDFVFQEYPQMKQKGFYYDVPYTWRQFSKKENPEIAKNIEDFFMKEVSIQNLYENIDSEILSGGFVGRANMRAFLNNFNLTNKEFRFLLRLLNDGNADGEDYKIKNVGYVDLIGIISEIVLKETYTEPKKDNTVYINCQIKGFLFLVIFNKKSIETALNKKISVKRKPTNYLE
ncbi:MAG: hypothetical protein ACRCZB_05485 [Bacteroidales bacterium]